MATYLDTIVAFHRERASRDIRSRKSLEREVRFAPEPRPFLTAIGGVKAFGTLSRRCAVIAEIKRRSPSKGNLRIDLDAAALARAYAAGGATCLSVLTDAAHFRGSAIDLRAAREATNLPVLRKDFTVSRNDVLDARIMGADAVLLIVAALSDIEIVEYSRVARDIGLDVLVEVHDELEAARAIDAGARLIGVNQRDLENFTVDRERARRVRSVLPDSVASVAESGIESPKDAQALSEAGFDAVLVGEAFVTAEHPEQAVRAMSGAQSTLGERA